MAFAGTAIGQHLCYVERKRCAPDNPIDVRLVRQLYGVVEVDRAASARCHSADPGLREPPEVISLMSLRQQYSSTVNRRLKRKHALDTDKSYLRPRPSRYK